MSLSKPLYLYEEIMLLALHDEKGTVTTGYIEHMVAGAVLAELLLDQRISIGKSSKQLVDLHDSKPVGDPIVDECLEKLSKTKRRASIKTWVSRLAGIKNLKHKVAHQLCSRKILRADEDTVLFLFTRKVYPEINPVPEKEVIERIRKTIFQNSKQVEPRTVILISLANGSNLLHETFGKKEIQSRKKRIEQIVNGEATGKATKDVIDACQTAVMVAVIMPAILNTVIINH